MIEYQILFAIYFLVFLFLAGIGIGDEMGFSNPNYIDPIKYALLWPFTLFLVIVVWLEDDI